MNPRKLTMLFLLLALVGCAPKPDYSLILWEQPSPEIAAFNHAIEINGEWFRVSDTGSMEPFLTGGDCVVIDKAFPFKAIKPGMVVVYKPSWTSGMVIHMAAAWSGDGLIMDGIANSAYENKANGGLHLFKENYIGVLVRVYTKRAKP